MSRVLHGAPAASGRSSQVARPTNPCQEKLDRLPWVKGDVYRIHEVTVEMRSTSPRFAAWMQRTFVTYRAIGEPDTQLSVAIGDEGPASTSIHTLYRGIVPIVRSRQVSTLARRLVDELESFSYPRRGDAVFVFATLLELDGRSALIPSYLASYLSRSRRLIEQMGIRMSSGPAVAVGTDGLIGPAALALKLPRGAKSRFGSRDDPSSELTEIRRRRTVDAVCWFSRAVELPVAPVSGARALYDIASDTLNLARLGGDALDVLSRLLAEARCFELRGDTPRSMLLALADAVRGNAPARR